MTNSEQNDVRGVFYVLIWVAQSVAMTIFNKLVLSSWKFKYPFFLTFWHMILFSILTRIVSFSNTNLMPSLKENKLTTHDYVRKILPFSLAAATQLVCSNSAYSFLSLAFIQILKAMTPVTLLILQYLFGKEVPSITKLGIVGLISFGVAMCIIGELNFNLIGFILQCTAVLSDNFRALLIDALLFNNKIDSLSMLYYIAPPSATLIGIGFVIFELPDFPIDIFTPSLLFVLLLNGLLAFSLNLSNVIAVSKTSILFLSVCSPIRDAMVILMSVVVFGAPLLPIQVLGFGLSLLGLYLYNEYKKNPLIFKGCVCEFNNEIKKLYDLVFIKIKINDSEIVKSENKDITSTNNTTIEKQDVALVTINKNEPIKESIEV